MIIAYCDMPDAQTFQRRLRLPAAASPGGGAAGRQNVTPKRIFRSGTGPAPCTIGEGRKQRAPGLDSHRERAMEQLRGADRNHKGVKA
jgi:hypothetical protein